MTRIDFHLNVTQPEAYLCRLLRKVWHHRQTALVYSRDQQYLTRLNDLLWTFSALDFIPHTLNEGKGNANQTNTPILLSNTLELPIHQQVLINLDEEVPPNFSCFTRMLELVAANEPAKIAGRSRYKFYRDRGYSLSIHDAAAHDMANRDAAQ